MKNIWNSLLAVQGEAPGLQRDGLNPHFKSEYVTLETLMETVLPILNKHGVVLVQAPGIGDGHEDVLVTRLIHAESGEAVESEIRLYLGKEDAQAHGSALTYARRYSLMAMLGLVADSDDDGNAAAAPRGNGQQQQRERTQSFNPAKDLAPGAITVRNADDEADIKAALKALDPTQPWGEILDFAALRVFGVVRDAFEPKQWGEFWKRLANAIVRADEMAGSGDFPPASPAVIAEAFAWAFEGVVLSLDSPVEEVTT